MTLKRFLFDKDFWRIAMRLALPIALQKLLISSFSMVDTIMIGALGGRSLAAVGLVGQYSFLINVVFFGFSSGAAVFIAQYWGNHETRNIRKTYGLMLFAVTAMAVAFSVFGFFFGEWFLMQFTDERDVIEEALLYFRIVLFSYPFIAVSQAASTLLGSTEEVRLPMLVSFVSVAINVVFNALFIFGLNMGVRGAAYATVLAAAAGPISLYVISFKRAPKRTNQLVFPFRELFGWNAEFLRKYMRKSTPVLLNEAIWALGTMLYNKLFSNLSIDFFTAVTIQRSIDNICYVFFIGLCHACAVIVGKHIGAGRIREGIRDAKRFSLAVPMLAVPTGLLLIALRAPILSIFREIDPVVIAYANAILLIYGLEISIRVIPFVEIIGVFRAGGDTHTGLIYDFVCLWLIALPLTWLGGMVWNWPLTLIFGAMLFGEDVIKTVLCLRHMLSGRWISPVTTLASEAE